MFQTYLSIYEAFWADEMKQPLNPPESSFVLSSIWMDEIHLFTATRAVAVGIATARTMVTTVNEASPEAGWIYYTRILGRRAEAKVIDNYKLSTPMTMRIGTDYSHEKVRTTQHWSVTSSKNQHPHSYPPCGKPHLLWLQVRGWRQLVK